MTLSTLGWLNGISIMGIFLLGLIFGVYFIYVSRKTNAKLLAYFGLFCLGTTFVGSLVVVDFITLILTGINFDNPIGHRFIWGLGPSFTLFMVLYVFCELLTPNKKRYILMAYVFLSIIIAFFVFLDFDNQVTLVYPDHQGEDVILGYFNPNSIVFILIIIVFLFAFLAIMGFSYQAFKSEGILRKRYAALALGYLLCILAGIFELNGTRSVLIVLVRIIFFLGLFLIYTGLKETTDQPKRKKPEKNVTVKDSLFRITKRPENLTEEEISISKEKKICLVCKGKVTGLTYICTECEAFYCIKCSQALSNLENECWACGTPIDSSKPVKKIEKEKVIKIEKDEKREGGLKKINK